MVKKIMFDIYHNLYSNTQTIIWTVIGYSSKFENSISVNGWSSPLHIQETELNIILYFHEKQIIVKLMKITYSAYQWYFLEVYIVILMLTAPTFSESEAACLVGTMKCWYDLTM